MELLDTKNDDFAKAGEKEDEMIDAHSLYLGNLVTSSCWALTMRLGSCTRTVVAYPELCTTFFGRGIAFRSAGIENGWLGEGVTIRFTPTSRVSPAFTLH